METTKKLNETPLIQEMTADHTYVIVDSQGNVSRMNDVPKKYVTETELTDFIKPYDERITTNETDIENVKTDALDLETYIDTITPKNTASGEIAHTTDALPLPTFGTKSGGQIDQFTTEGNQLTDFENPSWLTGISYDSTTKIYTSNSITGNYKGFNIFTTPTPIIIPKGESTFYYSCDLKLLSGTYSNKLNLIREGTANENLSSNVSGISNQTLSSSYQRYIFKVDYNNTSDTEIKAANYFVQLGTNATEAVLELKNLMISKQDVPYEPYTNGASPNPEYPQEIEVLEAYNLLKITTFTDGSKTKTINGITATINDNGTVSCKGTATDNATFYFTKNDLDFELGDAYFVCNSPSANQRLEFCCTVDGTKKYLNSYGVGNFITANSTFEFDFYYLYIMKGETVDNTYAPMFAKGKIQKPYLPYGCVGYKDIGKNLLPILNATKSYKQTTITCTNGIFHDITSRTGTTEYACAFTFTNDIAYGNYANYITIQGNIIELEAGEYTYSYKKISGTAPTYDDASNGRIISVFEYKNTQPYTRIGSTRIIGDTASITFTLTKKTKITLSYSYYFNTDINSDVYFTLQLEKSSTATEYEPYQEQIVYLDLKGNWVGAINDDIKDYLVTDKKKYWLVKNVKKLVLDGSESWVQNSGKTCFYYNNDMFPLSNNANDIVSAHYIGEAFGRLYGGYVDYGISLNDTSHRLVIRNKDITSVDGLKAKLKEEYDKGTPVTAYFLTNKTEIIELGELPQPIKTFEGVNNIQLLANLDTEIEVVYAQDVKKYIDSKLAEISAQII